MKLTDLSTVGTVVSLDDNFKIIGNFGTGKLQSVEFGDDIMKVDKDENIYRYLIWPGWTMETSLYLHASYKDFSPLQTMG